MHLKEVLQKLDLHKQFHQDLGEQKNLAAAEPEQTAKLLAKLRAWRKEVGAKMPTPKKDQP